MFLLLLMGLGAAGVKAQVRIGGNGAPNAAAILDLNATDATTGTKGLALPRVALTSATMLLSGVTTNLTGMMVYNTSAAWSPVGIYLWNGVSWIQASLPSTSAIDSGLVLMSNGKTWTMGYPVSNVVSALDSVHLNINEAVTWTRVLYSYVYFPAHHGGDYIRIPASGVGAHDICVRNGAGGNVDAWLTDGAIYLHECSILRNVPAGNWIIACYRPTP